MGYIDDRAADLLKKDASGNTIFYPWGAAGKGYVVSPAKAEECRSFVRKNSLYTLPLLPVMIVLCALTSGKAIPFIMLGGIIYSSWAVWKLKGMVKGLPVSNVRLTLKEAAHNLGRAYHVAILFLLEGLSLAFIFGFIAMLHSQGFSWRGWLGIAFFGFGAWMFGYSIYCKLKKK